jgi:hypothetical protein
LACTDCVKGGGATKQLAAVTVDALASDPARFIANQKARKTANIFGLTDTAQRRVVGTGAEYFTLARDSVHDFSGAISHHFLHAGLAHTIRSK